MTHTCRESTDPRKAGFCACGHAMPVADMPERDPAFEAEMLAQAEEAAERVFHAPPTSYRREVLRRLDHGAREYGNEWVQPSRDNLQEALFEPPDVSSYVLLELQRLRASVSDEDFQQLRMAALPAMAAAVASFAALQQLRQFRDELGADGKAPQAR